MKRRKRVGKTGHRFARIKVPIDEAKYFELHIQLEAKTGHMPATKKNLLVTYYSAKKLLNSFPKDKCNGLMHLMDGFRLAKNLVRRDLNVRVCFITAGEINMDAAREVHPLRRIGCFIKKPISRTIDKAH